MQTVLRQVPMTIVGVLCNIVVIFIISRVPAVTIIGTLSPFLFPLSSFPSLTHHAHM